MTPVVVMGGISADAKLEWWPGIVGPGGPLDPKRLRLIGFDFLRESMVTTQHQAAALIDELDRRDVEKVRIVGGSYGGMVGMALAARAPDRVERLVMLAAAHRPYPLATAWRSIGRQILDLSIEAGLEERGVALARALAMTTYRTGAEFDARFDGPAIVQEGDVVAPIDSYLAHHGQKYAALHSAAGFKALLASIDLHRVDPTAVPVPVHLIGFQEDQIVPPLLIQDLAQALPRCESVEILSSFHGHDAFLLEIEALAPRLRRILEAP